MRIAQSTDVSRKKFVSLLRFFANWLGLKVEQKRQTLTEYEMQKVKSENHLAIVEKSKAATNFKWKKHRTKQLNSNHVWLMNDRPEALSR